jgi:hypothetical protein
MQSRGPEPNRFPSYRDGMEMAWQVPPLLAYLLVPVERFFSFQGKGKGPNIGDWRESYIWRNTVIDEMEMMKPMQLHYRVGPTLTATAKATESWVIVSLLRFLQHYAVGFGDPGPPGQGPDRGSICGDHMASFQPRSWNGITSGFLVY